MKRILVIIVLSFVFTGNVYSKDVKLICKGINNDGISHVLIINDKKKMIKVEIDPGFFEKIDTEVYNNDEIVGNDLITLNGNPAQQMIYNIDRRSGVLTLQSFFFGTGGLSMHKSNCELFKKNKF